MKATTVSIADVLRHNRMDAEFHITLNDLDESCHKRAEQLEAELGRDGILAVIERIEDARYKLCLLELDEAGRRILTGRDNGSPAPTAAQIIINRVVRRHPALALAMIEANRPATDVAIQRYVTDITMKAAKAIGDVGHVLDSLPREPQTTVTVIDPAPEAG